MSTADKTYAWQIHIRFAFFFPSALPPSLSLSQSLVRVNQLWSSGKKASTAKSGVEHKHKTRREKWEKLMAKWKCEYIEMRSTILFYIVWHTSHDFSAWLLYLPDVNTNKRSGSLRQRIIAWIYGVCEAMPWLYPNALAADTRIYWMYHLQFATWKCGFFLRHSRDSSRISSFIQALVVTRFLNLVRFMRWKYGEHSLNNNNTIGSGSSISGTFLKGNRKCMALGTHTHTRLKGIWRLFT